LRNALVQQKKTLDLEQQVIRASSAYLQCINGQEAQSTEAIVVHSKGSDKNDGKGRESQGRLGNYEHDGIIDARIDLTHDLLQLDPHGKQTIQNENGIHYGEPH